MLKENENIGNKYNELLEQRHNNNGGGNPNTYLPQNSIPASNYINKNDEFTKGTNTHTNPMI